MKKIISIVFILLLVFAFSDCKKKKDLPKNIPDWLQEIILKEKKESRNGFPYSTGPRYYEKILIEEYTDGSSTFYLIYDITLRIARKISIIMMVSSFVLTIGSLVGVAIALLLAPMQ